METKTYVDSINREEYLDLIKKFGNVKKLKMSYVIQKSYQDLSNEL
jgi:hypothetical protein